ncbi:hypothetical protein [Flavobacterium arsenatis]|uniref:hypothetical protein n=1 Tax=Flavobacterium arsenatis TaxID=1484332 RepID=UPI00286C5B08|nr:hypothetical protein [Flavobacterium arsenatis]
MEGLAESSQSKYIFLSELINRKARNKTSLLSNLFYKIDGENFVTFVKFLWRIWKESTFIFPDPATNPIYSNTDGSLFLPYQSEKTIGFYFTSLKVVEKTNTALAVTYETGKYETYIGKDPGGAMTTKSRKVTETESYHPYYPIYLVKTDQQDFLFDDLKHETLVPAFVLYANELKTFWSNVVTTGEYTVDILTTLSGVGNIAKFRHLAKIATKAQKLSFVSKTGKAIATAKSTVVATAAVVEISSGTINILLKLTGFKDTQIGKALNEFLFYMELLSLGGELTAAIHNGIRKNAKEILKHEDDLRKTAKNAEEAKQIDEVIDELRKNADNRFKQLNSIADPVADILGAAYKSHPERLNEIINILNSKKVEIIYKETETLGYSPGLSKGNPGQIHIHKEASISGWEHEFTHFLDDEAEGFLGMESLFDLNYRVTTELNAYTKEIDFVKNLKGDNSKVIEQLKVNFKNELEFLARKTVITDKNILNRINEFNKY